MTGLDAETVTLLAVIARSVDLASPIGGQVEIIRFHNVVKLMSFTLRQSSLLWSSESVNLVSGDIPLVLSHFILSHCMVRN